MGAKSIVMLSGGLDSMVLAYKLSNAGKRLKGIFLDFGMKPTMGELAAAKQTANQLEFSLDVVDLREMKRTLFGYIPIEEILADELDVGEGPLPKTACGFPVALSIATYMAQITSTPSIHVAVIKEQTYGRPELKNFFSTWPTMVQHLSESAAEFKVKTPFIDMTKAEVMQLGREIGVPMETSWSCTNSTLMQCGICASCIERRNGFKKAEIDDSTRYEQ